MKLIFARGSGEDHYIDQSFMALNAALGSKMQQTNLSYQSEDLDYPAPAVGTKNLHSILVTLGAAISGGESYEFGRSVNLGINRLVAEINSTECPNTKYVLGGYSQGAMLLDKALHKIDSSKVLYAATFGDPKIYLPEGKGVHPDACQGKNLSDYRTYVPECHAYSGILGGYVPYRTRDYIGKAGTWCNAHDILCSNRFNVEDHVAYVRNGHYEDASRIMYAKIAEHFNIKTGVISPHDTAILIDSTGSMSTMIESYKKEALRLAEQTINSGGRVALFDYRDLADDYQPVEHCNFETCTLDVFKKELETIQVSGGGDKAESLLSASLKAMSPPMKWKNGATKSLIVLTDASFHSPDLDATKLEDVIQLSKKIDPVNFYIITTSENAAAYQELADRTDGKVVTNLNELNLLTDYILDRYDSLPRVEESDENLILPTLTIEKTELLDASSARISYVTDAPKTMVFLNDALLGVTDQKELTLTDLETYYENNLTLVPLTDSLRGEPVSVRINEGASLDDYESMPLVASQSQSISAKLPKAPDTGRPSRFPIIVKIK